MNINEMSDQEKSVILARLIGWEEGVSDIIFGADLWISLDGQLWKTPPNLYIEENMARAWGVLNWMMNYPIKDESSYRFLANFHFRINFGELLSMPPAAAQRLWLDKILELAIEAGMV